MVQLLKVINGLVVINPDELPKIKEPSRVTRSSFPADVITFEQPQCRTKTYQDSFMIRACRIWNIIPVTLRKKSVPLSFLNLVYWNTIILFY